MVPISRFGRNATIEEGYEDAHLSELNLLAVAKSAIGEPGIA
ncbi:hypothetical protein [Microvirga makkahensis]|nr:hypothetical protein [Microvirga makkahensis]